jgi:hypothetical protein
MRAVPASGLLGKMFLRNYAWTLAARGDRDVVQACNRAIFRVAIFLSSIIACVMASVWSVAGHFGINPVAHLPGALWLVLGLQGVVTYFLIQRRFARFADHPEAAAGHDTFRDLMWLYGETLAMIAAIASMAIISEFWR